MGDIRVLSSISHITIRTQVKVYALRKYWRSTWEDFLETTGYGVQRPLLDKFNVIFHLHVPWKFSTKQRSKNSPRDFVYLLDYQTKPEQNNNRQQG